jgi:hypothetical protein
MLVPAAVAHGALGGGALGSSDRHACIADLYWGEFGSTPGERGISPEDFGSGKLGTPCVRMHLASLSACAGGTRLFGTEKPAGNSDLHRSDALWNAGELATPLGNTVSGPLVGSGKFGTPWDRMHRAYLSSSAVGFCDPAALLCAVALGAVLPRVVLREADAVPQPASASTVALATRPASEAVRHTDSRREDLRLRVFIVLKPPSGWVAVVWRRVVRNGWFQAGPKR